METAIGKLVKKSREKAKLSQSDVSQHLGWESAQFVSNIERGLCYVPIKKARKLCRLLKLDFEKDFMEAVFSDTLARYRMKGAA